MAEPTQSSENAATTAPTAAPAGIPSFFTIRVRQNGSESTEAVKALKSTLEHPNEHSTITAARAHALGYKFDANDASPYVNLEWRSPGFMKPGADRFLVVRHATVKDGVPYHIVLSSELTESLLLQTNGLYIALVARTRAQGLSLL